MPPCSGSRGVRVDSGFAYLWVLLLVAFMGVSLTLGIQVYFTGMQRDKERELIAIGHQFRAAIGSYVRARMPGSAAIGGNEYPRKLEDLLNDPRSPGLKRHLRKVFVDPMTGREDWGLVTLGDRIVGIRSLSTARAIKQANFDDADQAFTGTGRVDQWLFVYPPNLRVEADSSGAASSLPVLTLHPPAQGRMASEPLR